MTPQQKDLVRSSLEKMKPMADAADALFYGRLFKLDPSLERLLQNTLEEQGPLLMQILGYAVKGIDCFAQLEPALHELGARYAGYGVSESVYETVRIALLWTVKRARG